MLLPPHKIKAKKVTEKDLDIVYKDAAEMLKMCFQRRGFMGGAYAISHAQVSKEPLDFFVTKEGRIICNLEIVKHSKTTVDSVEHCLTFFYKEQPAIVQRWNVIEVEYEELQMETLIEKTEKLSGKQARIFQHEFDHSKGIFIYDINFDAIEKEQFEAKKKEILVEEEKKDNQSVEILQ